MNNNKEAINYFSLDQPNEAIMPGMAQNEPNPDPGMEDNVTQDFPGMHDYERGLSAAASRHYTPEEEYSGLKKEFEPETKDAIKRGIYVGDYNLAKANDIPYSELADADDHGLDVSAYVTARSSVHPQSGSVTHNDLLEAHSKGIPILPYSFVRNSGGASHSETLDVAKNFKSQWVLLQYGNFRSQDHNINPPVSHEQALQCIRRNIPSIIYLVARKQGLNHEDALCTDSSYDPWEDLKISSLRHSKTPQEKEAIGVGLTPNLYWDLRNHFVSHNEAIEVGKNDIHPFFYLQGRAMGVPHRDLINAKKNRLYLNDYNYCRRDGATHDECIDARDRGISLEVYHLARASGATHKEVVDYCSHPKVSIYDSTEDLDYLLRDYGKARSFGATHDECIDATNKISSLGDYAYLRDAGANHNEAIEAVKKRVHWTDYEDGRKWGATHKEIMDATDEGLNLRDYAHARHAGATHDECVDANDKGLSVFHYGIARNAGVTHDELLDIHNKGIDFWSYMKGRESGKSHEDSLGYDPSYDPWEDTKLSFKISTGTLNLKEQIQIFEKDHLRTLKTQKLANEQIVCPICGGPLHLNRASGDFTCLRCGKIVVRA